MANPHYQRLIVSHRKYFQHSRRHLGWLILLVGFGLLYWRGSYQVLGWLPIIIFGLITVLGSETARFVSADHQQPIYEMTLLTPVTAKTIVDGYRQAALARTARWFGLNPKYLATLVSGGYFLLTFKMYGLIEDFMWASFTEPNGTINPFFEEEFIRHLILLVFTMWASLLFSTLTYYLLAIEVNIELGLRFDKWLIALGAGIIMTLLVLVSSFFVIGSVAFIASLFAYLNEYIPIIVIIFAFSLYPLYWRKVFRDRALGRIRAAEKIKLSDYVDVA